MFSCNVLFFKIFILYCSRVDLQCQFQVYSKVIQLYIGTYLDYLNPIFDLIFLVHLMDQENPSGSEISSVTEPLNKGVGITTQAL